MMNRVPPSAQTYGFPPGHPQAHGAGLVPHQQQHRAMGLPPQASPTPNKGTLVPGQILRVGKIQVTVDRYLSEGGFAHVYLVKTQELLQGRDTHVLKRIAVRDRNVLDEVRREVEVMKLLRGHPNIVHLHDADAFHLPDGTHEVFILMEYCAGGGIIDLLNSRLQSRLSEQEILTIFVDVLEGVAKMHSLRPKPLVHRDLKVENILQAGEQSFKLCDFGSAAYPKPPPQTLAEIKEVELDINTHTTMQYRSPEMVDVYQRRPIDEKADIWALGVFLYKLCYYTTPFEEHGPLAILNVQYRVPPYPVYSNQLNLLVGSMLQEHGSQRPSAVQLLKTVHSMRGTRSQNHYDEPISSQSQNVGDDLFNIISAVGSAAPNPTPVTNIKPMRRGRPTRAHAQGPPQVPVPVANPQPPPNKGPTPKVLTPQYTLPAEPVDLPPPPAEEKTSLTPQYTIPATPLDAPVPAAKLSINVTGEKSPAAPSPVNDAARSFTTKPFVAGSWSSFGSGSDSTLKPSARSTTPFDGFADLEEPAPVKPAKKASSGLSAFISPSSSLGPPSSLPPRKASSSSLSAASAFDGFADSFTDSFAPLSSSPQPMEAKPLLATRTSETTSASKPLQQSHDDTSDSALAPLKPPAAPEREKSFDERYPSVEELDLRSASTSPLPTSKASRPAALKGDFMPHAGRSYTGAHGQPTPSIKDTEPVFPLPRSTQVTGIAMRDEEESKPQKIAVARDAEDAPVVRAMKDNGSTAPVKQGPAPPKQLEDWLTGDVNPSQDIPALEPTPSPHAPLPPPASPKASASPSLAPPPVATKPASSAMGSRRTASALKGPRSPPAKAVKPPALKTASSSSIMSKQWSPVEAARAKLQSGPQSAKASKAESSDDEATAPEDPVRRGPSATSSRSYTRSDSTPPSSAPSGPKPDLIAPKELSPAGQKSSAAYTASLLSSNMPRRLPSVDPDSAATSYRGSTTLGRASTISSSSASMRPRPRPQSMYSASSLGGATGVLKSPVNRLPSARDDTGFQSAPSAANAHPVTPAVSLPVVKQSPVPIIAPKPQRQVQSSNVAQRFERGSPIAQPAKRDPPPLKRVTPEATGGQAAPAVIKQPQHVEVAEAETAEERKSVKSLISRWNQQH